MSAIEATCAGFKDMADGTVRFFFDVEPRHAGDALTLFRARGTAAALAALKPIHQVAAPEPEPEPEPEPLKGGTLAQSAGIICGVSLFQDFAWHKGYFRSPIGARALICEYCKVVSRRELDHVPKAAIRYRQLMEQFRNWSEDET